MKKYTKHHPQLKAFITSAKVHKNSKTKPTQIQPNRNKPAQNNNKFHLKSSKKRILRQESMGGT